MKQKPNQKQIAQCKGYNQELKRHINKKNKSYAYQWDKAKSDRLSRRNLNLPYKVLLKDSLRRNNPRHGAKCAPGRYQGNDYHHHHLTIEIAIHGNSPKQLTSLLYGYPYLQIGSPGQDVSPGVGRNPSMLSLRPPGVINNP